MTLFGRISRSWQFTWSLKEFLKEPMTLEQSREIIRQRLKDREKSLLTIVKSAIYGNNTSPYLQLLGHVGCEYGDFERMVCSNGIESTLQELSQKGVYITVDEFKGKKALIRGSSSFEFRGSDFNNPFLSGHLEGRSSGSRSTGTRTVIDFKFLAENQTVYIISRLDAYDALHIPFGLWMPIMPGIGPLKMLASAKRGRPPARWFSQVNERDFNFRMATNYMIYMGRMFGARLPAYEFVPLNNALRVAHWMATTIKEEGGCSLETYTSSAVRVCRAAKENGIDLNGAKFFVVGEPFTEAKRKEIEAVGGKACPYYAFVEAGVVGLGCTGAISAGDVHLLTDSFALIQRQREVSYAGVLIDAFLFTTLLASTPKILLNVESGDYGLIENRNCGCKLEELGYIQHINNIRGFDKLTAEGITFIGTEFVRIMEEVLPAKFGGSSTDYQMIEEEDDKGQTHLSIIVSPEVGGINEADLIQTILTELSKPGGRQMASNIWSQANTLRLKRMHPLTTERGKLLPLHIRQAR